MKSSKKEGESGKVSPSKKAMFSFVVYIVIVNTVYTVFTFRDNYLLS